MSQAFAWIGKIVEWIGQWIPRWQIVPATLAFVKYEGFFLPAWLRRFKGDLRVTPKGPGLFWYWPATTMIDNYPTVLQADNLPSQTFETLDGVTITASGRVSYRISDIAKVLTSNHSPQKTIEVYTLGAIHDVCCRMNLDALKDEQRRGTLKTKLRKATQNLLTPFGVEVDSVALTDLARTRAYRLIQSTQQDEVVG